MVAAYSFYIPVVEYLKFRTDEKDFPVYTLFVLNVSIMGGKRYKFYMSSGEVDIVDGTCTIVCSGDNKVYVP